MSNEKIDLAELDERARLDGYRVIVPTRADDLAALVRAVRAAIASYNAPDNLNWVRWEAMGDALAAFTDSAERP